MKYIIFQGQNEKKSYLPFMEFVSYVDEPTFDKYMKEKGISDKISAYRQFRADIADAFNSYAPHDRSNSIMITEVANSFSSIDSFLRRKQVDECRLDFAEYATSNYVDPFPTLLLITQNITKHNDFPIKEKLCEKYIQTIRDCISNSYENITKGISDTQEDLWDSAENNEYAVSR